MVAPTIIFTFFRRKHVGTFSSLLAWRSGPGTRLRARPVSRRDPCSLVAPAAGQAVRGAAVPRPAGVRAGRIAPAGRRARCAGHAGRQFLRRPPGRAPGHPCARTDRPHRAAGAHFRPRAGRAAAGPACVPGAHRPPGRRPVGHCAGRLRGRPGPAAFLGRVRRAVAAARCDVAVLRPQRRRGGSTLVRRADRAAGRIRRSDVGGDVRRFFGDRPPSGSQPVYRIRDSAVRRARSADRCAAGSDGMERDLPPSRVLQGGDRAFSAAGTHPGRVRDRRLLISAVFSAPPARGFHRYRSTPTVPACSRPHRCFPAAARRCTPAPPPPAQPCCRYQSPTAR